MQGVYANSSWIMRPRNIKAAYHHLEPLIDYTSEGAEIVTNYDKSGYPTVTYPLQDPPSKTYVGITYITDFENNKVHVKYVKFKSDYVLNNCYNPLGFSDLEKISEYDIEDDFDLEKLKSYLPEEEHTKIPSDAFKELKKKYVGDFVKSFFIGVAMVALSAISYFWGGAALAGLASYFLSSVPAVLPTILTATLITQIAVIGGHIKIND
jgi:hypothetical protein